MTQGYPQGDPRGGHPASGDRVESITDPIPPAEPIHGAHDTYDKGEVGSIGALISDISGDLSTLIQQELALAKAELKQSAAQAGKGAGLLGGAGVAGHLFLIFLSAALMWALADWMDSLGWAALVVAIIWGVVAAVLGLMGRSQLQQVSGMPQTVDTAKRVPDALKGNEDHR